MKRTFGLTLDATFNPDFSQVETDAGQVDVTLCSALFYPEKRPTASTSKFILLIKNTCFGKH